MGGHERRGSDGGSESDLPVSLYPLDFEDALSGLLAVDPRAVREGDDDGDG